MSDTLTRPAVQPSLFIPHGGGPCFFMPDPRGTWTTMEAYLRGIAASLPEPPRAILVVSGHWEGPRVRLHRQHRASGLIFDYYGFPPETYRLPGPRPARRGWPSAVRNCSARPTCRPAIDPERGFDHGVFIPLKVAFPDADVPVVADVAPRLARPGASTSPQAQALAPLREEGVLVLGSGMSFHNLRAMGDPRVAEPSQQFDRWLAEAAGAAPGERARPARRSGLRALGAGCAIRARSTCCR